MDFEEKAGCSIMLIWLCMILFFGGCWIGNVVKLA